MRWLRGRVAEGSLYDNNNYHEECLRCNSCGLNLTGPNQTRARRYKNQFLCDLHFADVALMETSDFLQQLRSFKPQSLGCAVARRKSSTTLIFPLPPQACAGWPWFMIRTTLNLHWLYSIKDIYLIMGMLEDYHTADNRNTSGTFPLEYIRD